LNAELGMRNAERKKEDRRWEFIGMRKVECGKKKRGQMTEIRRQECGIGTRRRPIGRDYAAAKDAECLKVCGARRRV
jgi:hypothetical protein